MIGNEQGQSAFGGCPGDNDTARIIELIGSNAAMLNFADLVPGANFMEQVCLDEKSVSVSTHSLQ